MGSLVVVLGMHRSGTSFLAKALQAAGLYLGSAVADAPAPDNLDGYFEALESVRINDRILCLSGGSWECVPAELRSDAEVDTQIKAFLESLSCQPIAGWKDPRTTLTFPLWKRHLQDYRIVACFRPPLCVAKSLQVRNGLPLAQGLSLWAEYNERLLQIVKSERRDVFWFDFGMPPRQLCNTVTALIERLGLCKANVTFNPYLRHQAPESGALEPRIQDLYERLREHARRQSAAWALTSPPDAALYEGLSERAVHDRRPSLMLQRGSQATESDDPHIHLARVQGRQSEVIQQHQRLLDQFRRDLDFYVQALDERLRRLERMPFPMMYKLIGRVWRKVQNWAARLGSKDGRAGEEQEMAESKLRRAA